MVTDKEREWIKAEHRKNHGSSEIEQLQQENTKLKQERDELKRVLNVQFGTRQDNSEKWEQLESRLTEAQEEIERLKQNQITPYDPNKDDVW